MGFYTIVRSLMHMSQSQNDNVKNKPPKVSDVDVSKIDDKAGIHSTTDSDRRKRERLLANKGKDGELTKRWHLRQQSLRQTQIKRLYNI